MQPCVWVKGPGCEQFGEARYRSWHLESVAELTVAEVRPRCGRGAAEVRPRCGRGAAEVRPKEAPDHEAYVRTQLRVVR